jgi:general secretion pathway protein G
MTSPRFSHTGLPERPGCPSRSVAPSPSRGLVAPIRSPGNPNALANLLRRRGGFTLIELMVVMVLIALLLTLAVPRYFSTIDTGKDRVQRQNISAIRDAIDKYYGDLGKYPDALQDLVDKHYLRSVPLDPITGKPDWVIVAPTDPNLTGVYDIKSNAKPPVEGGTNGNGS